MYCTTLWGHGEHETSTSAHGDSTRTREGESAHVREQQTVESTVHRGPEGEVAHTQNTTLQVQSAQ